MSSWVFFYTNERVTQQQQIVLITTATIKSQQCREMITKMVNITLLSPPKRLSINQSINQSINTERAYTETYPALYK